MKQPVYSTIETMSTNRDRFMVGMMGRGVVVSCGTTYIKDHFWNYLAIGAEVTSPSIVGIYTGPAGLNGLALRTHDGKIAHVMPTVHKIFVTMFPQAEDVPMAQDEKPNKIQVVPKPKPATCHMCRRNINSMWLQFKIDLAEYPLCISCIGDINPAKARNAVRTKESRTSKKVHVCQYCLSSEYIPTHQYVCIDGDRRDLCRSCWDTIRKLFYQPRR